MPSSSQPPAASRADCFSDLTSWQDYVNDHFPPLEMVSQARQSFQAQANSRQLGDYSLTHIGSAASEVARTPQLARRANAGYVKVIWQLAGRLELSQDRRSLCLDAGRATLCDTARPYTIRVSDGARLAVLLIPHEVDPRLPRFAERLSAVELADRATMQAALGAITGLARSQPSPGDPSIGYVMQGVGAMLSAAFARATTAHDSDLDSQRLQRAREHIARHLADAELSPGHLATALCVSRRTLYGLLARHGTTPARLITEIRLQQACSALARDDQAERSITDIALAHGFGDGARFSHVFKDRYGQAPSVWRRQQHGG